MPANGERPPQTLSKWEWLLDPELKRVDFPSVEVRARDWDDPVLIGHGQIDISDADRFDYRIKGRPTDIAYAMSKLKHARENPYDTLAQFRVEATDGNGVEWTGGYTHPDRIDLDGEDWILLGEAQRLITTDPQAAAGAGGVELVFLVPISIPIGILMTRRDGAPTVLSHEFELLGSEFRFDYSPALRRLVVRASSSPALKHPWLENWIGEPFRILFGQLIYPRLTIRNFGDGRAMVALNPSPPFIRNAGFAALWNDCRATGGREAFWDLYRRLLTVIAQTGEFESHTVTRFYEEIVQASRGSRWVWALTLASAAEGLTRRIIPYLDMKPDEEIAKRIEGMAEYINKGPGTDDLKSRAIGSLHYAQQATTARALRHLRDAGHILPANHEAWQKMRHPVMHGELITPWSTQETDTVLINLADLMHRLTLKIAGATT